MEYWDDMTSKWGFNDGDAVPPDAGHRRDVYVHAINALAERYGSNYRVTAFDRPGMHNWCLITNVLATGEDTLTGEEADEALGRAISTAHDMALDQYVTTTTVVDDEGLDEALEVVE